MFLVVAVESWDIKKEAGENDFSHIIRQIAAALKSPSPFLSDITHNPSVATTRPLSGFLIRFICNINNSL